MPEECHQFGDLSRRAVTNLEASARYQGGDMLLGMKGKFPNGLRRAMDTAKIGVSALARAAKTPKQNISRLADGERKLTVQWAELLAPHLGRPPEELILASKPATSRVPLLSWVAAGKLTAAEGVTNVDAKRFVTVADLPAGAWIALTVDGDSMNLVAPPGSTILVNREDERLLDERFYVFSTGDGAATFKRFRSNPIRLQPFSTNPDHETQYPGENLHIVGRVRRVITDLK